MIPFLNIFLHSLQKLIGQMHQEVTAKYVKRLLKGELKLKDRALQLKACETVMKDAENLHSLFVAMVRRRNEPTVFWVAANENL